LKTLQDLTAVIDRLVDETERSTNGRLKRRIIRDLIDSLTEQQIRTEEPLEQSIVQVLGDALSLVTTL